MVRRLLQIVLICFIGLTSTVAAETEIERALSTIAPGTRADLSIAIPAGANDPATFIPITILKGTTPGPTVLMTAGVHGYEFAPILAAARLSDRIDPALLSGNVILVRIAHIEAFEARSPYVNPNDRKNLNRDFPGDPEGSQTERIAAALSTEIIPSADFVLDVHSGDGAEWLEAFVGVYGGPLASDYATAFKFAEAMGFPNVIHYSMQTQEQIDRGRSLNRQAVAQGLPTILVEIGQNGSRDPKHAAAIERGVMRGLASLGMLTKAPSPQEIAKRYFDGAAYVSVQHSGVWTPVSAAGRFIQKGETIGTVRDYSGATVETVKAPASGYGLYGLAGPPIRAGESVITIALPTKREALAPTNGKSSPDR
ncbi:MAG: succinylglutamate desuccinylase/aspartoacylase family protein [Pseudomonadota bacterium]